MSTTTEKYPNVITFTKEEIEGNPFVDSNHKPAFYRKFVSKAFGIPYDNVSTLDCDRLIVSGDIWDSWFRNRPADASDDQMAMALVMCGPKVDHNLPNRTVRFMEGCVICKE